MPVKTDRIDARNIAWALHAGWYGEVHVKSQATHSCARSYRLLSMEIDVATPRCICAGRGLTSYPSPSRRVDTCPAEGVRRDLPSCATCLLPIQRAVAIAELSWRLIHQFRSLTSKTRREVMLLLSR